MTKSTSACPSCKRPNIGDGRYCIYCGSILNPVYCSYCGTINPDDLEQCLECGNRIPKSADVPWTSPAPLMNPSSAMMDTESEDIYPDSEAIQPESKSPRKSLFSRLRQRIKRGKETID